MKKLSLNCLIMIFTLLFSFKLYADMQGQTLFTKEKQSAQGFVDTIHSTNKYRVPHQLIKIAMHIPADRFDMSYSHHDELRDIMLQKGSNSTLSAPPMMAGELNSMERLLLGLKKVWAKKRKVAFNLWCTQCTKARR